MARLKDALCVLNGLGKVAVAYSAEVSSQIGDVASRVSTTLQDQCGIEERREHGLPDDFPGWENFKTGEFGLGAEYNGTDPTSSYQPPPDPRQPWPESPTTPFGEGQRSLHTAATQYRRLLHYPVRVGHRQVKWMGRGGWGVRHMSSGDTVVDSPAGHRTGEQTSNTHMEQQRKV